jgi:4-hydroxythreonine-4-phosphate dehydrogenase
MKWRRFDSVRKKQEARLKSKETVESPRQARLAVSIGCPCGIGPEVAVAAAADEATAKRAQLVLVGDLGSLRAAAVAQKIDPSRIVRVTDPAEVFDAPVPPSKKKMAPIYCWQPTSALAASDRASGRPGARAGAAQLAWIDAATDLVSRKIADAIVTGPVSKGVIARSGAKEARAFRGHTEHLASRLSADEVTMAFWTDRLTTSLVTTHLPLSDVPKAITADAVARATFWTGELMVRLGAKGKIAVAALNPHAGEEGLLGEEERREISPGIKKGLRRLSEAGFRVEVEGPIPAESAFRLAATGSYVAVVAMYHDQATIPMKLLGFGETVNVSLGLPIVRTSVDHGTAYDRAGKGSADPRGMLEAVWLAEKLTFAARAALF